jgi:hypothetical protein
MPAKCVKCEELFDMSYDYRGESEESMAEKETGKKGNKLLCWGCRNEKRR